MSLDLSHGFLAEAQVDTRVVEQIFAGNLMNRVGGEGVLKAPQGDGSELTLWLGQPTLTLVNDPDPAANIRRGAPYFRGHVVSREFHKAGCDFADLIKASNRRLFPTFQNAIQKGYDGCATCQPDFNVASFGDLNVRVVHPAGVEPDMPLTLTADYVDNAVRFNVPLAPDREENDSATPFDDGGVPTHSVSLSHIVPGGWTELRGTVGRPGLEVVGG